jgi:tRNA(Ile2) C34 agmatinyltransferase TiaS
MNVRQKIESSSLKPMCQTCMRRVFGIGKGQGWWCANCEQWIVPPDRKRTERAR